MYAAKNSHQYGGERQARELQGTIHRRRIATFPAHLHLPPARISHCYASNCMYAASGDLAGRFADMAAFVFFIACIAICFALGMVRADFKRWAVATAIVTLLWNMGLASASLFLPHIGAVFVISFMPAIALGALAVREVRRQVITAPVFEHVKKILPEISATEREALEAGTAGFDAELFSGRPNWAKLHHVKPMVLTAAEQRFLDGPAEDLCAMLKDWDIRRERQIPAPVWEFVKAKGFLGMAISRDHGGLGFSAQAQSLVLGKIASRSPDVAAVVMGN
jgi:acyl-CoA dehydrogenase